MSSTVLTRSRSKSTTPSNPNLKVKRTGFVFDFLEDKLSLSSMLGSTTTVVYSDPTAPAEPDPGPYPGGGGPVDYPTPVPGGPVGPGFDI